MSDSRVSWREPTRNLPLRWGSYVTRQILGICLIFAGGLVVQLTSAYSLIVLPLGLAAHIFGWLILPAIGWRRVFGAVAGSLAVIVLLNGASATWALAFPLAAWFLIRQRPVLSYLALVLPVGTMFVLEQLYPDYGWGVIVLSIAGVVVSGAAWLGRTLVATSRASTGVSR